MGRNRSTILVAILLVLCVSVAFAGGKQEVGSAEGEVYKFSLAWAPWSVSMGRQSVKDQPKDPYWQYMAENLGVVPLTISWEWDGGRTYMSQLRLQLASGDVPEALKAWDLNFTREIIEMGITIPLDDLLEEHGQDILNAFSEEDWEIMRSLSPDGKIHSLPNYMGIHRARTGFIRKDWLDRVGMDVPTTRDELLAVYKAFKEQDANGNGDPNDEIPVSGRAGMRWSDDLFNMHGVVMYEGFPQWRWDPSKQQLISEQVSEEMKNAVEFLRLLVEEGYMDLAVG
ncbi:MAG TPA: extracellular solute-binding protein [bacterium]|nr:extracellular solute-binding protein [bacterium]